jgi:hypothetical protein
VCERVGRGIAATKSWTSRAWSTSRRRPSPALDSAYIIRLNPLNGEVGIVATNHMANARAGHQALLLCDGTVLVSGGTPGGFTGERHNPPPTGSR